MNDLYNYFEEKFDENKLVQSYLIGNTSFDEIKEELFNVFNKFFFKNDTNLDENPDLYVLKCDEGVISKDDIKNLLKNISTTSQFSNIKIYVIDECEKLNDFAYNAILKTLEEPSSNVYAFLISKNIDSVKLTIVSRCQKIFISSESKVDNYSEEDMNIAKDFIIFFEENNLKTIGKNPLIYSKISDRNVLNNVLSCMLNIYMNSLKIKDNDDELSNYIRNNNDINELSLKILVLNKNINLLNSYLNKNLVIDRVIIEMWRCKNENS